MNNGVVEEKNLLVIVLRLRQSSFCFNFSKSSSEFGFLKVILNNVGRNYRSKLWKFFLVIEFTFLFSVKDFTTRLRFVCPPSVSVAWLECFKQTSFLKLESVSSDCFN